MEGLNQPNQSESGPQGTFERAVADFIATLMTLDEVMRNGGIPEKEQARYDTLKGNVLNLDAHASI
jgi:hypothetical protein